MTQANLQSCYCDHAQKADAQLNDLYQQLLKKNVSDTSFIEKLKISETAWIAFRDAQIEAIFPDPDPKSGVRLSVYYVRMHGSGEIKDGSR